MIDIVTLFRYILQQSRKSDSGRPAGAGPFSFWRMRVAKRGGSKAEKAALTVVGGASPKARKARAKDWTKAKEALFLTTLAETCNVTAAAAAAGVSVSGAYARRKKVAAFRAGWAEAIAAAYQRLELVMLDRALNGTEKIVVRKDGSEERMRDYPNQIALHLLKMHRDGAMEAIEEPVGHNPVRIRDGSHATPRAANIDSRSGPEGILSQRSTAAARLRCRRGDRTGGAQRSAAVSNARASLSRWHRARGRLVRFP